MLYPEGVKLLIKPDTTEEVTAAGIIIPETVRDKHDVAMTCGKIIAIGPKAVIDFSEDVDGVSSRKAKVGDTVIFARYGGAEIIKKKKTGERVSMRVLNDEDVILYDDGEEWE